MNLELPKLPFAKKALEPHMSANTLNIHHGKHHNAYVVKGNELLADANISADSLEELVKETIKAGGVGQFGSGWVWLVNDCEKLKIAKSANAETPLTDGATPILVCDVWEHAYYLDFQNRRPDFLGSFLDNLVNWDFANKNLADA